MTGISEFASTAVCPACHKSENTLIWSSRLNSVYKCNVCPSIFKFPIQDIDTISEWFDESYYRKYYISNLNTLRNYTRDVLVQYIGTLKSMTLLEIGAGIGLVSEYYVGDNDYFVIEISEYAKDLLKKNESVKCFDGFDALRTQYNDLLFDRIIMIDSIGYCNDISSLMNNIRDVIKNGGEVIIRTSYVPDIMFSLTRPFASLIPIDALFHLPSQVNHFTPARLTRMFQSYGFVLEATHFIPNARCHRYASGFIKNIIVSMFYTFLRILGYDNSFVAIFRKPGI